MRAIATTIRLRKSFIENGDPKGPSGNNSAILAADASRLAALLVGHMRPACSLLAPCDPGASAPRNDTVISGRALTHKTISAVLQLVGATCIVVVVLTHFAEALHLLPAMRWGEPDGVGHYVDLFSAVLGVTITAIAYVLRRREWRSARAHSSA